MRQPNETLAEVYQRSAASAYASAREFYGRSIRIKKQCGPRAEKQRVRAFYAQQKAAWYAAQARELLLIA
ncbi:MAG TPA: hypothetical protein VGE36_04470 [Roseateles sp.]